jgi:hypothetical protein
MVQRRSMSDERLIEAYEEYMLTTDKLLSQGTKALELAPIMVKLGLEIYKTVMSEEDYNKMVDFISDNRGEIQDLSDLLPEIH